MKFIGTSAVVGQWALISIIMMQDYLPHFDSASPNSSPQFYDPFLLNFKSDQALQYKINVQDPEQHEQVFSLKISYRLADNAYDEMLASSFQLKSDGTIIWNNPKVGVWLFKINAAEKINGVLTGAYVEKEYIINVQASEDNDAPVFATMQDLTVKAGELFTFEVEASESGKMNIIIVNMKGMEVYRTSYSN